MGIIFLCQNDCKMLQYTLRLCKGNDFFQPSVMFFFGFRTTGLALNTFISEIWINSSRKYSHSQRIVLDVALTLTYPALKNTFQLAHSSPTTQQSQPQFNIIIYSSSGMKNTCNITGNTAMSECTYAKKIPWIYHSLRLYTLSILCGCTSTPTGNSYTKVS